jgi:lipopolysaccharide export LptBFGC system permease protein LptF
MMSAFVALGRNGALNPYLSAWIPNVIMGAAGALLIWRVEH